MYGYECMAMYVMQCIAMCALLWIYGYVLYDYVCIPMYALLCMYVNLQ